MDCIKIDSFVSTFNTISHFFYLIKYYNKYLIVLRFSKYFLDKFNKILVYNS